ncbi:MAG TPA: hypothetical protein VEC36_01755, partial [Patescibacteria group bacterium]|nr:hypothetical protein [Patescibacteria group bacterium]
MEYSTLIDEFLDGTLAPELETGLFSALIQHDDLRTELRESLAIKTAIPKDHRAFIPSVQSTTSLFAKLNIPSVAAATGAASVGSFRAKYHQGIVSSIVTSLIVTALFLLSGYFTNMQNGNTLAASNTNFKNEHKAENGGIGEEKLLKSTAESEFLKTTPQDVFAVNSDVHYAEKSFQKNGANLQSSQRNNSGNDKEIADNFPHQAAENLLKDIQSISVAELQSTISNIALSSEFLKTPQPIHSFKTDFARTENSIPVSIHIRNIQTLRLLPNRPLTEETPVAFNNMAVSVSYLVSDELSFGTEAGRESFPIYKVEATNSKTDYISTSGINHISIYCRYSPQLFAIPLKPFG